MKHFTFRCVKITFEEKKTIRSIEGEVTDTYETTVSVLFEQTVKCDPGYGHASLYLSSQQFAELNYQVGKEYLLCPVIMLDSVSPHVPKEQKAEHRENDVDKCSGGRR